MATPQSMFENILGNEQVKSYLKRIVERGTVGNSLLFAGPDGIGKALFAEAFAKLLICHEDPTGLHKKKIDSGNHPDIRVYRPEGKVGMHSIASMRQFSQEVYLAPAQSKWKVFIVHDADRMLTYSANALLKTFEEPAKDAVIILLSSAPKALLPTVLSRCRTIFFQPLKETEIASHLQKQLQMTSEQAIAVASMSQGSMGQAVRLASGGESPLRKIILDILSKEDITGYKQLSDAAATVAAQVDEQKKEVEGEVRKALMRGVGDDLTAVQKQGLEKEIEGAVSMHATQEAYALFDIILSWYRDKQLIQVNGNTDYMVHRDYRESCQRISNKKEQSLESVQKAIQEARLGVERSTTLQICLENLFLKLNLLT